MITRAEAGGAVVEPVPSIDTSSARIIARDLRFPEGPVACDDGSVLVSELTGTLARIGPDGRVRRYECGGGVNGAAFGPDGLYLSNNGGAVLGEEDGFTRIVGLARGNERADTGHLQRLDLESGAVDIVETQADGRPLGWLNDIVFDTSGGCYFIDTSMRNVCYAPLSRPGAATRVAANLARPNGAALSPDGTRLYVSETDGDVLVWDVQGPGVLAERRVLFEDLEDHGWDGLAVDGAGNVCVANLSRSGITVISPTGELLARLTTPEHDPWVTNICFGGADRSTAYVCSAGRGLVYAVEWPWGALRLNFAQ